MGKLTREEKLLLRVPPQFAIGQQAWLRTYGPAPTMRVTIIDAIRAGKIWTDSATTTTPFEWDPGDMAFARFVGTGTQYLLPVGEEYTGAEKLEFDETAPARKGLEQTSVLANEMAGLLKRMRAIIRDQAGEIEAARAEEKSLVRDLEKATSDRETLLRLVNEAREALALALAKLTPGYPLDTDPRYQSIADAFDNTHFPLGDDKDSISELIAVLPGPQ